METARCFPANSGTVYYLPGTTGWGSTFGGWPTALWYQPKPLILGNGWRFGRAEQPIRLHDFLEDGKVVGMDRDTDLAVVKIDRTNLPYLTFGDSDELKQGQIVLALGNPLGLDNSVSLGVVSAVSRQCEERRPHGLHSTDAPITQAIAAVR